jgi:hypothetical protein
MRSCEWLIPDLSAYIVIKAFLVFTLLNKSYFSRSYPNIQTKAIPHVTTAGQWTEVESLPEKRAFPGSAVMNGKYPI